MKHSLIILAVALSAAGALAQTEEAYESGSSAQGTGGLLDPARFSIRHAVSFGMSSSNSSSLKSQSLYTSMIQYQFAKPITVNLNVGIPIHSTYNSAQNMTPENIESTEYFKNIPFDVSLTWQPKENLMFQFSVVKRNPGDYYASPFYRPYRLPYSNVLD